MRRRTPLIDYNYVLDKDNVMKFSPGFVGFFKSLPSVERTALVKTSIVTLASTTALLLTANPTLALMVFLCGEGKVCQYFAKAKKAQDRVIDEYQQDQYSLYHHSQYEQRVGGNRNNLKNAVLLKGFLLERAKTVGSVLEIFENKVKEIGSSLSTRLKKR